MVSTIPRLSIRSAYPPRSSLFQPSLLRTRQFNIRPQSTQASIDSSQPEPPPEPLLASGPPPPQKPKGITRTIPSPKRSSATSAPIPTPPAATPTPSSLLLRSHGGKTSAIPPPRGTTTTEPYTITRTPSANLPIYHLKKRGGNLKITELKKIGGDKEALRGQLMQFLEPRPQYIDVRKVNGVFWIKGWYKQQLENFLVAKGF